MPVFSRRPLVSMMRPGRRHGADAADRDRPVAGPVEAVDLADAEEVVQLTPGPLGAGSRLRAVHMRLTGFRQRFEPLMILATRVVFRRFHRRLKRALESP